MTTRNALFGGFCLVSTVLLTASAVQAQAFIESSQTATPAAAASSKTPSKSSKPAAQPAKSAGKKSKSKGSKKAEDASPKTTKRPTTPTVPPDPDELKLRPDQDGLLQFNFRGQPWPELLTWLADVSKMSLDWQELPSDYLNLVTQRKYTVDEARDLINSHLLVRGFTMLRHGEVLSVVSLKELNPAMVPRVRPEDLEQRDPHEIVKVSLPLDWLIAEQAVAELKPMLSPNGKLTQLKATNRLEAIDVVINLREIYSLLKEEQSGAGQERLVRPFKLRYTNAVEVLEQLQSLLGIKKSSAPAAPMSAQQRQQMQQAAARARANQAKKGGGSAKPKADVFLVVNKRENSILANAPPDKMAIISQAIKLIDVPSNRSKSLLLNMNRMQVYRLAAIEPEPLVKVLNDLGQLDFDTRLEVDTKNRAIIAYASLADHVIIRSLIDKLDGSGREFSVFRLRRLEADYVAGTIQFMMGGEEEKKETYDPWSWWRPRRNQKETKTDKFRVDADVENNQLLLWANDIEVKEVENLLTKLGEIRVPGSNRDTVRVIEAAPGRETEEMLRRIQQVWPSLGPNRLVIPSGTLQQKPLETDPQKQTNPSAPARKSPVTNEDPEDVPAGKKISRVRDAAGNSVRTEILAERRASAVRVVHLTARHDKLAADWSGSVAVATEQISQRGFDAKSIRPNSEAPRGDSGRDPQSGQVSSPPPISITVGPQGQLIISSQDTRALDRLEELMSQLAPPRQDYRVFHLKYANAAWVQINLEEYFETDDKDDNRRGLWG